MRYRGRDWPAARGHACFAPMALPSARRNPVIFVPPYSALRLAGEALIVARVDPGQVQWMVESLRAFGSPGVFVLQEESAFEHPGPNALPDPRPLRQRLLASLLRRHQEKFTGRLSQDLEEALNLDHALTAAAEWLLDNAYLVRTHVGEMRRFMPRRDSRVTKTLASSENYFRLYDLARGLVTQNDCAITGVSIYRTGSASTRPRRRSAWANCGFSRCCCAWR